MKTAIVIIFVLLISAALFAYDIEGGRQMGMAGTIIMSEPSAHGLLNCPIDNLYPGQFVIESSANRKYGLADLDQISFLTAYRFKKFTAAFGFSQFGTPDYYTEKIIKTVFSYHVNSITPMLITSGRLIEIGDVFGKLRAASIGIGVSYHEDNYYFGLTLDDINNPKIAKNVEGESIKLNIFAEISGGEKHSVTGRLILEKYEKPFLSLGQFIHLTKTNGLFWGMSLNPLKYGGGFEIVYKKFSVDYGVSHHPVLGFSHSISLSYIFGHKEKSE